KLLVRSRKLLHDDFRRTDNGIRRFRSRPTSQRHVAFTNPALVERLDRAAREQLTRFAKAMNVRNRETIELLLLDLLTSREVPRQLGRLIGRSTATFNKPSEDSVAGGEAAQVWRTHRGDRPRRQMREQRRVIREELAEGASRTVRDKMHKQHRLAFVEQSDRQ